MKKNSIKAFPHAAEMLFFGENMRGKKGGRIRSFFMPFVAKIRALRVVFLQGLIKTSPIYKQKTAEDNKMVLYKRRGRTI